jgi:hypothetical protein
MCCEWTTRIDDMAAQGSYSESEEHEQDTARCILLMNWNSSNYLTANFIESALIFLVW